MSDRLMREVTERLMLSQVKMKGKEKRRRTRYSGSMLKQREIGELTKVMNAVYEGWRMREVAWDLEEWLRYVEVEDGDKWRGLSVSEVGVMRVYMKLFV
jgi:hypothetical protein